MSYFVLGGAGLYCYKRALKNIQTGGKYADKWNVLLDSDREGKYLVQDECINTL